jgi:hypothetical protein
MKREPIAWGYNRATLFLRDINRGTWPSRLGSLECEAVKCGHESRGTLTSEWLRWRGPAAIVNDRPILSWKRMLHKDYNRKCSVRKQKFWSWVSKGLSLRRSDWWWTTSRKVILTLTLTLSCCWVGWESCSREKWEAGRWCRGQFTNSEEGKHPPLEASTKQQLVKTEKNLCVL